METLLFLVLVFTLFSLSQYLLSKGAEARQKARGSLLDQYTEEREDFGGRMDLVNESSYRTQEEPISVNDQIHPVSNPSFIETEELDSLEASDNQDAYDYHEHTEEDTSPSIELLELVELDQVSNTFLNKLNGERKTPEEEENVHENYVQDPMFDVEDIASKGIITFPEVDITLSNSPESGHFYIAGEIKEKYDDVLVLADDGTKERVFEHFKFREFEEKDVFIGQVIIEDKHWHLFRVWVPMEQGKEDETWKEVS